MSLEWKENEILELFLVDGEGQLDPNNERCEPLGTLLGPNEPLLTLLSHCDLFLNPTKPLLAILSPSLGQIPENLWKYLQIFEQISLGALPFERIDTKIFMKNVIPS